MQSEPEISRCLVCIVVPLCNEADSIELLRTKLAGVHDLLGSRYCLNYLYVDDGSTDDTRALLSTVSPKGASFEIHTHESNRGVGAAFRTAFEAAKGDVICTIDADCSYGPEGLLQMIDRVVKNETDVIVASPYHPEGVVVGVQAWRIALSAQCSRSYRLLTPLKLYTYTSIFRAYKGSVIRDIQFASDGFVSAVEILLSASSLGYRVTEMPMTLHRRTAGTSKMRIAHTIAAHSKLLFRCLFAGDNGFPRADRQRTAKREVSAVSLQAGSLQKKTKPVFGWNIVSDMWKEREQ